MYKSRPVISLAAFFSAGSGLTFGHDLCNHE